MTVGALVWDAVSVGIDAVSVAVAVCVAAAAVGDVRPLGVAVSKTVAVAAPVIAAAEDLTCAAVALTVIALGTPVEVGSGEGVYRGRAASTAGVDSALPGVRAIASATAAPAGLATSGVSVAACNLLSSMGVSNGTGFRVALTEVAEGVNVGTTFTAFPLPPSSGAF